MKGSLAIPVVAFRAALMIDVRQSGDADFDF